MNSADTDPNTWAENLHSNKVQIWREGLQHLRHLSDEVWKGVKFFLLVNGVILLCMAVIIAANVDTPWALIILPTLSLLGLASSLVGRYVLKRNRIYYLEMLLTKTLIEDEFGFYSTKFSGTNTDLAFPWRLKPETIPELKQKPEEWVRRQIRGYGTIALWLFLMLESAIVVYLLVLVGLLIAWLH